MAQQHERGQHGGGLVEDVAAAPDGHHDRVDPAGAHRDGHQHHHVQRLLAQRADCAVEEDPGGVEDNRKAQQELEDVVPQTERRRHAEVENLAADRGPEHDRD